MFRKDPSTNMVINTDESHYKAILSSRSLKAQNAMLVSDLQDVKAELSEIRDLLKKVINK